MGHIPVTPPPGGTPIGGVPPPHQGGVVLGPTITPIRRVWYIWKDGTRHAVPEPAPKPAGGAPGDGHAPADQQSREATVAASGGPIPLIYGTQRVGGRVFYINVLFGRLVIAFAFCEGPVSSITEANILVDGEPLVDCMSQGWIDVVNLHDGSFSQTADSALSGWFGYTQRHPGLCYAVLRLTKTAPWTSMPEVLAKINGLLLYDPRVPTTAFSNNPALVARDAMARIAGLVSGDFDDGSVGDSATYYDATVDGEKRYTIDLAIVERQKLSQWLANIRGHCGLNIYPDQGKYIFAPDRVLSSPIALDDSHLRDVKIRRKDSEGVPTRMTVTFTNPLKDWISDSVVAETDAVAAGTEDAVEGSFDCPGITSAKMAQRHALYLLRRENFCSLEIEAVVSPMAEQLRKGDYVTLTTRGSALGAPPSTYRLNGQGAIVKDLKPNGNGEFSAAFEEYDANAFSTANYAIDTPPATYLPDPYATPDDIALVGVSPMCDTPSIGGAGSVDSETLGQEPLPGFQVKEYVTVDFTPSTFPWAQWLVIRWYAGAGCETKTWEDMADNEAVIPATGNLPPGANLSGVYTFSVRKFLGALTVQCFYQDGEYAGINYTGYQYRMIVKVRSRASVDSAGVTITQPYLTQSFAPVGDPPGLPLVGKPLTLLEEASPAVSESGKAVLAMDSADHKAKLSVHAGSFSQLATLADLPPALPVGTIVAYGGSSAPSGWFLCDGAAKSQSTYAALYAVIGTTFGNPGGGNFNLPDLRQRFPLGKAASGTGSTLGGTGGNIDHVHTGPSHSHTVGTLSLGYPSTSPETVWGTPGAGQYNAAVAGNDHVHTISGTTAAGGGSDNTGGGNPPFQVVNFIIRY